MASSILSLLATILVPMLKWVLEKRAGKKLNDKEFTEIILAHQDQRNNAGQTALDWKDSVAKLKARLAKKKQEDSEEKDKEA